MEGASLAGTPGGQPKATSHGDIGLLQAYLCRSKDKVNIETSDQELHSEPITTSSTATAASANKRTLDRPAGPDTDNASRETTTTTATTNTGSATVIIDNIQSK